MATTDIAAPRPRSMDYRYLRAEGLRHIQRLSGKVWTDHNAHDPGVTMLEALCFALTDLGLRTHWGIADQLVSYAAGKDLGRDFYEQYEILPNAACTPLDFRKLIIDFLGMERKLDKGVVARIVAQNAWLSRAIPSEVPPLHINGLDEQGYTLGFQHAVPKLPPKVEPPAPRPFLLNGLYETQLRFERNLQPQFRGHPLRDLNDRSVRDSFVPSAPGSPRVWMDAVFPSWDEMPAGLIYGALNNPQGSNLRAGSPWGDQWGMEFKNAGTQGPILQVGLNVELDEEFVLNYSSPASNRNYRFCLGNPAIVLLALMGTNTISILRLDFKGQGVFEVEVGGLHTSLVTFELRCTSLWGEREEARIDVLKGFIQSQLPLWLRKMVDIHKQAISTLGTKLGGYFAQYQVRLQAINDYIEGYQKQPETGLKHYLCGHRNLCEDWLRFLQVPIEEVGLECELILAPGANPEAVLSEILFQIDQFLSPCPKFQGLTTMLEEAEDPAAVFDGPLLQHGFLRDGDLGAEGERQHYVFCSDMVRIIMAHSGVSAIHDLGLSGYVHGRRVVTHAGNCLALSHIDRMWDGKSLGRVWRKPQLDDVRSMVTCSRDGVPLAVDWTDVRARLDAALEAARAQRVAQIYTPTEIVGDDMLTAEHQSVQNDLPQHYGTSAAGMSMYATPDHKGKVKQLKGYLLFFDQLLTNYLGQLNRLRELFTFRDDGVNAVGQTYFVQLPLTVPEVESLILPFVQNMGVVDWPAFQADLEAMAEGQAGFLARRNVFLSHVAGRFGESFADYAAKLYAWHYAQGVGTTSDVRATTARANTDATLLTDKKGLLLDLPRVGAQRGRGFCLRKRHKDGTPDQWDSHNITGLKRRVCRLLGIRDERRRYLTGATVLQAAPVFAWNVAPSPQGLRLRVERNNSLFMGDGPPAADLAGIEVLKQQLLDLAVAPQNYSIVVGTKNITIYLMQGKTRFFRLAAQVLLLSYSSLEAAKAEAQRRIDEAVALFLEERRPRVEVMGLPEEGFHVIEHILLRPKSLQDALMWLPSERVRLAHLDPYSMRATIIVPRWTGRFRDPEFSQFVERSIRMELPAHVMPWVIWVDDTSEELTLLHTLENAWRAWLEANALASPSVTDIQGKHAALIAALNQFHQYYLQGN